MGSIPRVAQKHMVTSLPEVVISLTPDTVVTKVKYNVKNKYMKELSLR